MKKHNLSGMTAEEAIKSIEWATGLLISDQVRATLEQLAILGGGRIQALEMDDLGEGRQESISVPGAITEAELAAENYAGRRDPEIAALYAKHGEPGPYNGVLGDSCRCDVCNLRRRTHAVCLTNDMDKRLSILESADNLARGYKGKIPEWAGAKHIMEFVKANQDNLAVADGCTTLGSIKNFKVLSVEEQIKEKIKLAREAMSKHYGPGSEQLARFDEMDALMSKPSRTVEELSKAVDLTIKISEDVEAIERRIVTRSLADFLNAPQRFTQ